MAYDVRTKYKIIPGEHLMQLVGFNDLEILVTATRNPTDGVWTVTAAGVPDVTAPTVAGSATPRSEVISAMVNQALASVPDANVTVTVPHNLPETP